VWLLVKTGEFSVNMALQTKSRFVAKRGGSKGLGGDRSTWEAADEKRPEKKNSEGACKQNGGVGMNRGMKGALGALPIRPNKGKQGKMGGKKKKEKTREMKGVEKKNNVSHVGRRKKSRLFANLKKRGAGTLSCEITGRGARQRGGGGKKGKKCPTSTKKEVQPKEG